jgi:hypothetical protein
MIIQTAPSGEARLAIKMHEHTALAGQFARAFGNDRFSPVSPRELMVYVTSNHDAGWAEFDRDPITDSRTRLPYNLIETPAEYITVTSRKSPEFNEKHHAYCGLMSSMHSWGLYNGRYGLSNLVLIDKIPPEDRPLADQMLAGEIKRQEKLKAELAKDSDTAEWLDKQHFFQNYKQLQFFDTLALYFNRIHPTERTEQRFENVPLDGTNDTAITIRPNGRGVYEVSPFPFSANNSEFAYAGRPITPAQNGEGGHWTSVLSETPTRWESFRLVAP